VEFKEFGTYTGAFALILEFDETDKFKDVGKFKEVGSMAEVEFCFLFALRVIFNETILDSGLGLGLGLELGLDDVIPFTMEDHKDVI